MECAEIQKWIFRKIDGELSESEDIDLDAHLAQCASCAREFKLLGLPSRLSRGIPQITPPPFFYQRLRARIESEAQAIAGWQALWGMARRMVPALAGITLALLSVLAYVQLHDPQPDFYTVYERVFITDDQPQRMFLTEQGEITDETVLSAIAERQFSRRHAGKK
jgi:hypothetical protein